MAPNMQQTVVALWCNWGRNQWAGVCTNPDGLKSAYSRGCPWFTILPASLGTGVWKYYVNRFCEVEMSCGNGKDVSVMAWGVLAVVIAYCDAAVECAEYRYNRCNWLHSVACGEWIDICQLKVHLLHQYAQNLWCTRLWGSFDKSIGDDFNSGSAKWVGSWWEMCAVMCDLTDDSL